MPTRTINLRMQLGKQNEGLAARCALWRTHEVINRSVAEIEALLLLCRGDAYWYLDDEDKEVQRGAEAVRKAALAMARRTQRRNGKDGAGTDEQVLGLLRRLYETLVPSCLLDEKDNPVKGDAQSANALVSPLMDPDSKGGLSVFDKVLAKLPEWVPDMAADTPGWRKASEEWLKTEEAKVLSSCTGAPPGWVRRLRAGKPWQEEFLKDQDKKRRATEEGAAPMLRGLREIGLLPLLAPPVQKLIPEAGGRGVSVWDRMAVRLAVAHMLSWESWNHTTRREHAMICERLRREKESARNNAAALEELRGYERERQEQLKRTSLAKDDTPYRVRGRAARAWQIVRDEWRKGGSSEAKRKETLTALQTKLRGRFGDPELFGWLAAAGREHLWRTEDPLTDLVRLNELTALLERKREYALFTEADARLHPRWAMFEKPGGSNLRNYDLFQKEGRLFVKLSLLGLDDAGALLESEHVIPLAASGQLGGPKLSLVKGANKKKLVLEEFTSAHQRFSGEPGGSEILFDRGWMEGRDPRRIEAGDTGPVWFKLTLDVDTQAPPEWRDGKERPATPPEAHYFKTALVNKSKFEKDIGPGLRVLAVDMGLRSFAACSVFELVDSCPEKGLFLSTPAPGLWARHERSFLLRLPGEDVGARALAARREADGELRTLKRGIRALKDILRLGEAEGGKRAEQLAALAEAFRDREDADASMKPLMLRGLAELETLTGETQDAWRDACLRLHTAAEQLMAQSVSEWRRRTRPRSESWEDWRNRRAYAGSKSIWMIEHLDRVRKTLISWSLRGREYGKINRLDRAGRGTFASHMLDHINSLKEDRTKTGADLIIQAARGFVPAASGWDQRHAPCRLILFEDLARYRFRSDRPRRENSQLMKWSHREILRETEMQAQIYGILCDTTAAGYSSRFHAATGAPGVRCRRLEFGDFDSGQPKPYVLEQAGDAGMELQPGTLLPWEGGEQFATVAADGSLLLLHADINAAQNLQRRLWTRCGDAFRLSCRCVTVNGLQVWYPERLGVRLRGALIGLVGGAGYCRLEQQGGEHWIAATVSAAEWRRALGAAASDEEIAGEDEAEETLAALEMERGEGREVFFRDPAGVFFPVDAWVPAKAFWATVRARVLRALMERSAKDDIPY